MNFTISITDCNKIVVAMQIMTYEAKCLKQSAI
jgi:hypothetical protein